MVEFVILNIRCFLCWLWFFQLDLLKFYCLSFFRLNRLGLILYRLSGLISSGFRRNLVFIFNSGSHKMLKILIEIRTQVFHDNNFFLGFFVFYFFGLISFRLYYIGLMTAYCAFRWTKKVVCVSRARKL